MSEQSNEKWRQRECVIPTEEILQAMISGLSGEHVALMETECADIVEQSLLAIMRRPDSDFYSGSDVWRPYECVLNPEEIEQDDELESIYNECVSVDVADRAILNAMRT